MVAAMKAFGSTASKTSNKQGTNTEEVEFVPFGGSAGALLGARDSGFDVPTFEIDDAYDDYICGPGEMAVDTEATKTGGWVIQPRRKPKLPPRPSDDGWDVDSGYGDEDESESDWFGTADEEEATESEQDDEWDNGSAGHSDPDDDTAPPRRWLWLDDSDQSGDGNDDGNDSAYGGTDELHHELSRVDAHDQIALSEGDQD